MARPARVSCRCAAGSTGAAVRGTQARSQPSFASRSTITSFTTRPGHRSCQFAGSSTLPSARFRFSPLSTSFAPNVWHSRCQVVSPSAMGVMITIRRMALGAGFRYLVESVAAGDGGPDSGSGLTRYYAESRTPPGIFLGSGLASLGGGRGIREFETVSEEQLWRMLEVMTDPLTGQPVGNVPRAGTKTAAVAGFDLTFSPQSRCQRSGL
jgi:TrwC relaxase